MRSSHATLLIGLGVALLSLRLPWINYPLGSNASAWQISLLAGGVPFLPSLGAVLFGLVAIACYSVVMGGGKRVVLAGLIFSLISLERVVQLGWSDAVKLNQLVIENNQLNNLNTFNVSFAPINSNTIPNLLTRIPTETLLERFEAGFYFLDLGWYWAVAGGLVWFLASWSIYRGGISQGQIVKVTTLALLFFFLIDMLGPLVGDQYHLRARKALASGNPRLASENFHRAFQWDAWIALQWDQQIMAGSYDELSGVTQTDQYKAWLSDLFFRNKQSEACYDLMKKLASYPGEFGESARHTLTTLLTNQGTLVYKKKGYGSAALYWDRALRLTPEALDTNMMLVRSMHVQADYYEVIRRSKELKDKFDLAPFVANTYSDQGDAYTLLRDYRSAKTAYSAAFKLDEILNYRTLSAMVGP